MTITMEYSDYKVLHEDAKAFRAIKNREDFVHVSLYQMFGGSVINVVSNDDRVQELKEGVMRELKMLKDQLDLSRQENKILKKGSWLKRIFS